MNKLPGFIIMCICLAILTFYACQKKEIKLETTWYPEINEPYMQDVTIEYWSKGQKITIHAKELFITRGMKNETNRIQSETTR